MLHLFVRSLLPSPAEGEGFLPWVRRDPPASSLGSANAARFDPPHPRSCSLRAATANHAKLWSGFAAVHNTSTFQMAGGEISLSEKQATLVFLETEVYRTCLPIHCNMWEAIKHSGPDTRLPKLNHFP